MANYNFETEGIPREHLPIPQGGIKLLIMLTVVPLTVTGAIHSFKGEIQRDVFSVIGIAAGTALVYILFWKPLFDSYFLDWFKDYWRRNVVGMKANFYIEDGELLVVDIEPSSKMLGPGILIPLGGWFSKPRLNRTTDLTLEGYHFSDGYRQLEVTLADQYGTWVNLDVESAFKVLEFMVMRLSLGRMIQDHINCINWRDVARIRYEIIREAAEEIQRTSRFGKSKDAKAIKEQMVNRALNSLTAEEENLRPWLLQFLNPEQKKTEETSAS